jgi:hypothetical protein
MKSYVFKSLSTLIAGPVILTGQALVWGGSVAVTAGSAIQLCGLIKENDWEVRAQEERIKSAAKQLKRQLRNEEALEQCKEAKVAREERKADKAARKKAAAPLPNIQQTVQEMHQSLDESAACPA